MTNYNTLQQNTLLGLTEEAGVLYLRGCNRDERKSFLMACEWQDLLEPKLNNMLIAAAKPFNNIVPEDLYKFIRERHFRKYFPDGRKDIP